MMAEWLFVGGAGRTGTTLLTWCLAQHQDIRMSAYESEFPLQLIHLLSAPCGDADPVLWRDGDDNEWVQTGHQFRWPHDGREVLDVFGCAQAMLRGLADSVTDDRYLGDRMPTYSSDWRLVREVCPDCRIIFITRGRKATVDSWMRLGFAETRMAAEKEIYRREASAWMCPGAIWLRLEELNADPRGVLSDLFRQLDLDPARADWERIKYQVWGLCGPLN
jgi:hypothetical protein